MSMTLESNLDLLEKQIQIAQLDEPDRHGMRLVPISTVVLRGLLQDARALRAERTRTREVAERVALDAVHIALEHAAAFAHGEPIPASNLASILNLHCPKDEDHELNTAKRDEQLRAEGRAEVIDKALDDIESAADSQAQDIVKFMEIAREEGAAAERARTREVAERVAREAWSDGLALAARWLEERAAGCEEGSAPERTLLAAADALWSGNGIGPPLWTTFLDRHCGTESADERVYRELRKEAIAEIMKWLPLWDNDPRTMSTAEEMIRYQVTRLCDAEKAKL